MNVITNSPSFPKIKNAKVVAELSVVEVLDHCIENHNLYLPELKQKKLSVRRLQQFAVHGCKCYNCGIEGNRILVTIQNDTHYHVDMYHVDGDKALLMNRDHILPASKGGSNEVWNMRPACAKCNGRRGNAMEQKDYELAKFNRQWAEWYRVMFLPDRPVRRLAREMFNSKMRFKVSKFVAKLFKRGPRPEVKA